MGTHRPHGCDVAPLGASVVRLQSPSNIAQRDANFADEPSRLFHTHASNLTRCTCGGAFEAQLLQERVRSYQEENLRLRERLREAESKGAALSHQSSSLAQAQVLRER